MTQMIWVMEELFTAKRDTSQDLLFGLMSSGHQGYRDIEDSSYNMDPYKDSLKLKGYKGSGYDTAKGPLDYLVDFKKEDYIHDLSLLTPSETIEQTQGRIDAVKDTVSERLMSGETPLGALFSTKPSMDTGMQYTYDKDLDLHVPQNISQNKATTKFNQEFARKYYYHNVDKDKYSSYQDWIDSTAGLKDIESGNIKLNFFGTGSMTGYQKGEFTIGKNTYSVEELADLAQLSKEDFESKYNLSYDKYSADPEVQFLLEYLPVLTNSAKGQSWSRRGPWDMPLGHIFTAEEDYKYE